jgi:hypothetical protein
MAADRNGANAGNKASERRVNNVIKSSSICCATLGACG